MIKKVEAGFKILYKNKGKCVSLISDDGEKINFYFSALSD